MRVLIEVIGWSAALIILLAYGLLSTGRLDGRSVPYQAMNIAGAAGFIVNSGWNGALPSAALNVIWLMIGTYALWRKLAAH
jgi:hypothetical protein